MNGSVEFGIDQSGRLESGVFHQTKLFITPCGWFLKLGATALPLNYGALSLGEEISLF